MVMLYVCYRCGEIQLKNIQYISKAIVFGKPLKICLDDSITARWPAHLRLIRSNRRKSLRDLTNTVNKDLSMAASSRTIRRRLRACGYSTRKVRKTLTTARISRWDVFPRIKQRLMLAGSWEMQFCNIFPWDSSHETHLSHRKNWIELTSPAIARWSMYLLSFLFFTKNGKWNMNIHFSLNYSRPRSLQR